MTNLLKRLRNGATTLALAAVASVSFASQPLLAQTAETQAPAKATATTDISPAMWVVRDEDTTIYMFGTVHVLRPGLNWLKGDVKAAFDRADELVLEVIEPEDPAVVQGILMSKASNPQGTTLRSMLPDELRTKYETTLTGMNVPPAAFDQMKPWFAGITLTTLPLLMQGYDLNSGAEKVLTKAAKDVSKPLGQLETIEQQLDIFDSLNAEAQIEFLQVAVDGVPDVTKQIDDMVDAWGKADLVRLDRLLNEGFETYPGLYDAILTKRNANWVSWIQERMKKPGTVFMAVGAAHLVGKDSVQAQLAQTGIESERVAK
ncbi:TraB/GumN family protein [Blastomonas sp.]|uniref:TraB/GumN family protein n=1 Tax=Blastomonas sp. TaxID=1909299 RepID=UPI00359464E9